MITQHEFGATTWMDVFDPTSEELESLDPAVALERIQRLSPEVTAGMMLATVIEELVDGYFDSTDVLEDQLESIEDRIFGEPLRAERRVQADLFNIRRQLLELRRAVVPLREVLFKGRDWL